VDSGGSRVECHHGVRVPHIQPRSRPAHKLPAQSTFLAREIVELDRSKLDRLSAHFGVPYRFYVGTKTEFFDFIEQNRAFDSLGEDLGQSTFLAREIVELDRSKLDRLSAHFGVPYRFYVGTRTEFFDFIEQNRAFDSLGEDLGQCEERRRGLSKAVWMRATDPANR
jgi:hypothetical protein